MIVYLILLFSWNQFKEINVLPGLMFVGSFVMPFSILILFFELNTPKNISIFKVIQLTFIGGVIAILITFFLYSTFPNIMILGAPSAGIIEEVAKLAGLIMVLNAANEDRYPYRLNGLLLGAAVGTGFAAFESAGYALQSFSEVNRTMLDNIHLRALMAPFAHIAWTAITASAYWIARKNHDGIISTITSWQFLKLFFVSVGLHMIWNMNFTGPYFLKFWFLGFVSWVVIISLAQSGLKELSVDNQKV
jgi:RsiW-degrading membrane proteinase PrsW (M82 family)